MAYIDVDSLVQQMTPEQRILVSQFYSKFNIGSGVAHKKIVNVEELYYMGAITGSEFVTYVATKMYLCLSANFYPDNGNYADYLTTVASVLLYDENNAIVINLQKIVFTINSIDTKFFYAPLMINTENIYFSKLVAVSYVSMKFIGYRITLT